MALAVLGEEGDPLAAVTDPYKTPIRHFGGRERDGFAPFVRTDRDEAVLDDNGEALGLNVIENREDLDGQEEKTELRGHDDAPGDVIRPGILDNPIDSDRGEATENEAGEEVSNRVEGNLRFDLHPLPPLF